MLMFQAPCTKRTLPHTFRTNPRIDRVSPPSQAQPDWETRWKSADEVSAADPAHSTSFVELAVPVLVPIGAPNMLLVKKAAARVRQPPVQPKPCFRRPAQRVQENQPEEPAVQLPDPLELTEHLLLVGVAV